MSEISATSLVFFGDSLSDSGNLYDQSEGILPEFARNFISDADGQISNGLVWSQSIDAYLQSDVVLNYAVAGAESTGTQAIGDFLAESVPVGLFLVEPDDPVLDWDMNLGAQIDRFLDDTDGEDRSDFTAVILIGGNDFAAIDLSLGVDEVLAAAAPIADDIKNSTIAAANDLLQAEGSGVSQIVILTMPPFSFLPAVSELDPDDVAQYDALIAQMNADITDAAGELDDSMGGNTVVVIDLKVLTDAFADDASSFGLIADPTLTLTGDEDALGGFDDDQVMFWDDLHPTEATHGVIASFTAAGLDDSLLALTEEDDATSYMGADAAVVFGYGGNDTIQLGDGSDVAFGGSGSDDLFGFQGNDQLSGGSDSDILRGRLGEDVLEGGQDDDFLFGSLDNDVIIDGNGSDYAFGGLGDDTFIWVEESLLGGDGGSSDTLAGRDGEDELYVVLSSDSYATYASELNGEGQEAALIELGIEAYSIESVVVLEDRSALDIFSGEAWYTSADLWGLV